MWRTPLAFFKALGRAVLNAVGGGFLGDVAVDLAPNVARDVWGWWAGNRNEKQRREDLEALAQASPSEARAAAERAVKEVAGDQPSEVQLALVEYLTQVPAAVRQSLRRPSDPAGHSVPVALSLASADDMLSILPSRSARFKPGDRPLPGNDWELVELLGAGGFGEVWKARNPHFDGVAPVALKFCLDPSARDRLLRHEAAVLNQVMRQGRHPGIVALLHTYLSNDPPCLEYEYIEGGDLAGLMGEWSDRYSPLERFDRVARLVLDLARIVGYAHRLSPPIVHRDLKPANILVKLDEKGEPTLHITDFGIGGLAAGQAISHTRLGIGASQFHATAVRGAHTPLYASPQQMRCADPDVRDDVHAIGVIWYQFLTGNLTLGRPGGSRWVDRLVKAGVEKGLLDLLSSCVEEDPSERPADAQDLADQLSALIDKPATPTRGKPKLKPVPAPVPAPVAPPRAELPRKLTVQGIDFVLLPAGSFLRGSPEDEFGRQDDEGPQRRITISRPFYLATTPVTQRQYEALVGRNPSRFVKKERGGPDHPVEQVSWADAVAFCKRLKARIDGLPTPPVFRLPTEAEWEYACRAGTTTAFSCGDTLTTKVACFDARTGTASTHTTKALALTPNPWGLLGMHGNVWEWCQDWYEEGYYARSPDTDPPGPTRGSKRVVRGGSWNNSAAQCRSARRYAYDPTFSNDNLGFRVAIALAWQTMRFHDLPASPFVPDGLMFSPDGRLLAVQTMRGVDVLDTTTGEVRPVWHGGVGKIGTPGVGSTADGSGVVYFRTYPGEGPRGVFVHDLATGADRELLAGRRVPWNSGGDVDICIPRADGRLVYVAVEPDASSTEVVALDPLTGETEFTCARHRSGVRELAISADGAWLATAAATRLRVWSVVRPSRRPRLVAETSMHRRFGNLAFSADGAFLAEGGWTGEGPLRVWDVQARAELNLEADLGPNTGGGVAFAPDRPLLALTQRRSRQSGEVIFWDAASRAVVNRFDWGLDRLDAVAFSPDGCRCATASASKVVVWDVE